MKENIITAADVVAMFYRLQMNARKDLPIRSSEMGALIYIQKQEESVTPLMISNFFQIAKPSVTTMVNALIKKDYLAKVPSSTDGRSYTVSITEKGKELVELTQKQYFKTMELLEEKMGVKEFDTLIQLIESANNILTEERK